jgi:hypothetical protein
MTQYTSTTLGAEDIASYFISLLIIIIIIFFFFVKYEIDKFDVYFS